MDYCSACRRILNGALVCPGCGAYAPDIAPPVRSLSGAASSTATTRQAWRAEEMPASGSYLGTHHTDAEPIGSGAFGDAVVDASGTGSISGREGTASTGQGRAARRRQLARWKKNKRRAAAATAVALVGGGLTVAALPTTRASSSHTHAASPPEPVTAATPRTATTDSVSEQPDTQVSRHPNPHPPTTTSRKQGATVAAPHTGTTSRQPKAATMAPSPATPSATPHTTLESANATHVGNADTPAQAQAPETTAPASAERPGAGTSAVDLLPITSPGDPTSPTQICLIAVCVG
ncbi:SCO2400 family protein [Streptomyces atratus]|uniref:SCO2400 family protein n=1 Tax=Streptomyces atratus TaxID=1893 RepID=UPI003F5400D1